MMDLMTAANPVIQEEWAQRQYEGYPSIDDLLFGSITNPDWEVGAPGLDLLLASPQEVMVGGEIPIASSSWPQIEPKLSQQLSNMLPADDLPAIGSELIEFPAVQDDQEGLAREISASQSEHKSEKRPKKRRPFNTIEIRKETGLTRQMNACVRCRMQRIRVGYLF
jgi:hypothetical protein